MILSFVFILPSVTIYQYDTQRTRAAPRALAQAAWLTLSKALFSIFTANSGAGTAMSDSITLFYSSYANLGTTASANALTPEIFSVASPNIGLMLTIVKGVGADTMPIKVRLTLCNWHNLLQMTLLGKCDLGLL